MNYYSGMRRARVHFLDQTRSRKGRFQCELASAEKIRIRGAIMVECGAIGTTAGGNNGDAGRIAHFWRGVGEHLNTGS